MLVIAIGGTFTTYQLQPRMLKMARQRIASKDVTHLILYINVELACFCDTHNSREIIAIRGVAEDDRNNTCEGSKSGEEDRQAVSDPKR